MGRHGGHDHHHLNKHIAKIRVQGPGTHIAETRVPDNGVKRFGRESRQLARCKLKAKT